MSENNISAIRNELLSLDFFVKAIHEKKRISYMLNNIRFEIDTWPGIPTYLEIEAETPKAVQSGIDLLRLNNHEKTQESGTALFDRYNINFWSDLSFYKI